VDGAVDAEKKPKKAHRNQTRGCDDNRQHGEEVFFSFPRGHGKSFIDGIGEKGKNQAEERLAHHPRKGGDAELLLTH